MKVLILLLLVAVVSVSSIPLLQEAYPYEVQAGSPNVKRYSAYTSRARSLEADADRENNETEDEDSGNGKAADPPLEVVVEIKQAPQDPGAPELTETILLEKNPETGEMNPVADVLEVAGPIQDIAADPLAQEEVAEDPIEPILVEVEDEPNKRVSVMQQDPAPVIVLEEEAPIEVPQAIAETPVQDEPDTIIVVGEEATMNLEPIADFDQAPAEKEEEEEVIPGQDVMMNEVPLPIEDEAGSEVIIVEPVMIMEPVAAVGITQDGEMVEGEVILQEKPEPIVVVEEIQPKADPVAEATIPEPLPVVVEVIKDAPSDEQKADLVQEEEEMPEPQVEDTVIVVPVAQDAAFVEPQEEQTREAEEQEQEQPAETPVQDAPEEQEENGETVEEQNTELVLKAEQEGEPASAVEEEKPAEEAVQEQTQAQEAKQ